MFVIIIYKFWMIILARRESGDQDVWKVGSQGRRCYVDGVQRMAAQVVGVDNAAAQRLQLGLKHISSLAFSSHDLCGVHRIHHLMVAP